MSYDVNACQQYITRTVYTQYNAHKMHGGNPGMLISLLYNILMMIQYNAGFAFLGTAWDSLISGSKAATFLYNDRYSHNFCNSKHIFVLIQDDTIVFDKYFCLLTSQRILNKTIKQ